MLKILKGIYQVFRCFREFVISLFFILFVIVFMSVTSLMSSSNSHKKSTLPATEEGALLLQLNGYLADNGEESDDVYQLLKNGLEEDVPQKYSTFDVVRAIHKAESDNKIKGIVLDLAKLEGGDLASLRFIGKTLANFKKSGKPIIAIGQGYSQSQYYLASFASEIYLNKVGFVDLHGLTYNNLYFKNLLDKIEAVPHIFRVGTYKSAVEPFIRNDMSAEARQNAEGWLNDVWGLFAKEIADNRQIKPSEVLPQVAKVIEKYKEAKGDDAQYALNQKWVDELVTSSELNDKLVEKFGKDSSGPFKFKAVLFDDYLATLPSRFDIFDAHKIAVINVEGSINMGKSNEEGTGSESIVKLLRRIKDDGDVEGVILRVNSPGGSAMASELIRQELESLQQAGLPVVTSMGGMAASGGYWIAATSDKIIASPNTITGSIGIFGLAVTFEKTAKNLGLNQDGISLSPLAEQGIFKTLNKEQSELLQIGIENGYQRFLSLVSRGRNMSVEQVDKIAQGQVWSGEKAYQLGLVDKLGDFDDAYAAMVEIINQKRTQKELPEIKNLRTQWFIERDDSLLGSFLREGKLQLQTSFINWLGLPQAAQVTKSLGTLSQFNDPKNSYLYCLTCGSVK